MATVVAAIRRVTILRVILAGTAVILDNFRVPRPNAHGSFWKERDVDTQMRTLVVKKAQGMIGKYSYDKKGLRDAKGLPKSDDDVMDCSEFVYAVYVGVGIHGFTYLNSHAIANSAAFQKVDEPLAGDLVYWSQGHVAIVENPETGEFIGSQTSTGVDRSNYKTNVYWKARPGRAFYRWKDSE